MHQVNADGSDMLLRGIMKKSFSRSACVPVPEEKGMKKTGLIAYQSIVFNYSALSFICETNPMFF